MADVVVPDDYSGCGPYMIETCVDNPNFDTWYGLYGGGQYGDWSGDTGQDPPDAQICTYEWATNFVPCCDGVPCSDIWPTISSTNYTFINDIRWYDNSIVGGLNSIAPVNNPTNINFSQESGWDHNDKTTKYITELIAMDWGRGELNGNNISLTKGMDYRHQSYDGTVSSGEDGGFTTYVDNMGYNSNFSHNIIEQFNISSNQYTNTFIGDTLSYCLPTPAGGWIQDIKDKTRTNANFDFGCYPSEFISCSGYNQNNCSLAARMRQIYADERSDLIGRSSNSHPIDTTAQNFKPIVFSNPNILAWDPSNNNNNNVNGGINSLASIGTIMNGINLEGIVEDAINTEKGFPMGFFFNVAKFIVAYDDDDTTTGPDEYGNITQNITRKYKLKAGFKFTQNKNSIEGYGASFDPDNGSGIHLGGNNDVDPSIGVELEEGTGTGTGTLSGISYQIFAYLHNDEGGPLTVARIRYPFTNNTNQTPGVVVNGVPVGLSGSNFPLTNLGFQNLHNRLQAISTDGEVTYENQPNPGQGGNDFPQLFHYEYQDDYNLFDGGVLDLGTYPQVTLPFDFIHVDFNFMLMLDTSEGEGGLEGQIVTVSLRDQDGLHVRNNLGNLIMQTHTLSNGSNKEFTITTKINNQFSPLALDGTTGWSTTDVTNNLSAPSSLNTANNVNGIQKLYVAIDIPNATSATEYDSIQIKHVNLQSDPPSHNNYGSRGFSFSPLTVVPTNTPFWHPVDIY
tara:strand:+ start:3295 stop:5499 length:2205 start_codon:yes stop_codon:yes gene_type:complete